MRVKVSLQQLYCLMTFYALTGGISPPVLLRFEWEWGLAMGKPETRVSDLCKEAQWERSYKMRHLTFLS